MNWTMRDEVLTLLVAKFSKLVHDHNNLESELHSCHHLAGFRPLTWASISKPAVGTFLQARSIVDLLCESRGV